MNLLLDTHLILWAAVGSEKLSAEAVSMINSDSNQLYFSAVSIWEVVIKNALQRENFYLDPHLLKRGLVDNLSRTLDYIGARFGSRSFAADS